MNTSKGNRDETTSREKDIKKSLAYAYALNDCSMAAWATSQRPADTENASSTPLCRQIKLSETV